MDQEKMGKMIAKLRKEKNLTQEQLGQKLGVNNKAVSKWECGLTTPDISIVNSLADELGVTTRDLLLGQDKKDVISSKKNDKKINYSNKKSHIIICLLVSFLVILNFILMVFVYNNYNKYGYLNFYLSDKKFCSEGYIISSKNRDFVFLETLLYQAADKGTKDELKINKLKVSIINNDEVIFQYAFNEQYDDNGNIKNYYISDLLENFSDVSSINKHKLGRTKIDKDNFVLFLEYNTDKGEKIRKEYKLSIIYEEYNNGLFK